MEQDMTKGKILPLIVKFMIPLLIGDVFQMLYNMVDTIIVGRFVGADALAAVGSTGGLMYLIGGFAIGITAGFTVLTSQRYGAGDRGGVKVSVATGIELGFALSAILTVLFWAFAPQILKLMNTPVSVYRDALAYIRIICLGTLCTVFYNLFSAFLRAVGNSRAPLYFLVFSACLNVGLDLLFIITFHAGVGGAATATVLSQGISAVLCAVYTVLRVPVLIPSRDHWRPKRWAVAFEIRMGIPMALQYAITDSGIMIMQAAINLFGADAVASFTAASKIQNILMQGMIAMGQTMATFCGQNAGARDLGRIREGIKISVIIEVIYSIAAMALMVLPLRTFMGLFFSSGKELSRMMPWALTYAKISIPCYIPLAMIFIFRSSMEGCGYAMLPLICGLTELAARGGTAVLGIHLHSYAVSCACDPAAWLLAGIMSILIFIWMYRDIAKKSHNTNYIKEGLS
ncbi:MAG: MATE family efflux transporter [Pseudoramibacter sp.]|jgi:putative MATE family efflux protein